MNHEYAVPSGQATRYLSGCNSALLRCVLLIGRQAAGAQPLQAVLWKLQLHCKSLVAALVFMLVLQVQYSSSYNNQPESWYREKPCSVFILDVNAIITTNLSLPACDVDDLRIWPFAEEHRGIEGLEATKHHQSQYASPFFFEKALKRSSFVTDNINEATWIYVHSHCYHTWWLSYSIITEKDQTIIQNYIDQAHDVVAQLPRWKRSQGTDFVFFEPHAQSPGTGPCDGKKSAKHIVVERGQVSAPSPSA